MNSIKDYRRAIALSLNELKANLLLKNARVINVLSGQIHRTHVALAQGRIIGFGDYRARQVINLNGLYLAPGFIDGHLHLESSMVSPVEFARAVCPLGTTSVVCDPHEIANVLGIKGIKYILNANQYVPLSIYVMLPSCVPATPLETSGKTLEATDLKPLLKEDNVLGLAEVMNYPGIIFRDKKLLAKLQISQNKIIDGHAPGLSGKPLSAYIVAGIKSDHESTQRNEALEKLRNGMYLMIREGSAAKNLEELLKVVTPHNARRCLFVSDDRTPLDLLTKGHMNHIVKKAVKLGVDPVRAIQMATINPAEYFGLKHLGAIAPGYQADLVAFDNFSQFNIKLVIKTGRIIARNGKALPGFIKPHSVKPLNTINLGKLAPDCFSIKAKRKYLKVIELVPHQIITQKRVCLTKVKNGLAISDPTRDILKIAVLERHQATGNIGLGFVKGFGLKKGAIGSSVAHDSHNIIIVGTNDKDMLLAAKTIQRLGGGLVVILNGKVIASLALPIAGIISDKPINRVAKETLSLNKAAQKLRCVSHTKMMCGVESFMALSFLALAPIPELKLTDKGLIDVKKFRIVSLFENKT